MARRLRVLALMLPAGVTAASLVTVVGLLVGNRPAVATATGTAVLAPAGEPDGVPVDGITADPVERVAFHVHVHLQIYVNGEQRTLPAGIGILAPRRTRRTVDGPFVVGGAALYWVHTHDETGVVHIESPVQREFTLGDFFGIWGQPLGVNQLGPARGRITASTASASSATRAGSRSRPRRHPARGRPRTGFPAVRVRPGTVRPRSRDTKGQIMRSGLFSAACSRPGAGPQAPVWPWPRPAAGAAAAARVLGLRGGREPSAPRPVSGHAEGPSTNSRTHPRRRAGRTVYLFASDTRRVDVLRLVRQRLAPRPATSTPHTTGGASVDRLGTLRRTGDGTPTHVQGPPAVLLRRGQQAWRHGRPGPEPVRRQVVRADPRRRDDRHRLRQLRVLEAVVAGRRPDPRGQLRRVRTLRLAPAYVAVVARCAAMCLTRGRGADRGGPRRVDERRQPHAGRLATLLTSALVLEGRACLPAVPWSGPSSASANWCGARPCSGGVRLGHVGATLLVFAGLPRVWRLHLVCPRVSNGP